MASIFIGIIACILPSLLRAQWTPYGNTILSAFVEDACGSAAAISDSGQIIAVGYPFHDLAGNNAGKVQLFSLSNGTWAFYGQALYGASSNSRAGSAVALNQSGSIVAVGSPYNASNGAQSGQVEVYQFLANSWVQIGPDIAGEAALDQSGAAICLSDTGTILAVGARFNDGNGANSGQVRVFQYLNSSWVQLGNDIDGEMAGDQFGSSVSLSGDGTIVAIGAPFNAGNGAQSGQVRIFEWVNNTWQQLGADIDGEWAGEQTGTAVDLSADGMRLVVGAVLNDDAGSNAGQVRVFEYTGSTWQQIGSDLNGSTAEDAFGAAVSINASGQIIAVGAPNYDAPLMDAGQVRVYQLDSFSWQDLGAPIEVIFPNELSGTTVALSRDGGSIVVGAPGYSSERGALRAYRNPSYLPISNTQEALAIRLKMLSTNVYRFMLPLDKTYRIEIYDMQGRLQYSVPQCHALFYDWEASLCPVGLYAIRITEGKQHWTSLVQVR